MSGESGAVAAPARRMLYGRSRGKTLRSGQQRLLREALPHVAIAPEALDSSALFDFTPGEIWLEIGFGAGEHMIAQAAARPDVGLIGCEPFLNGVAAALAAIEREGLRNVRIRHGDAQALLAAAGNGFFSRIFILYPDPWPKRRHNRRRIISSEMICALARVLKVGGELRFATDIDDYAGWALRRFLAVSEFRWTAGRADNWRNPWPDWCPTRYEAKALKAGRGSVYLTFVRE